MIIILQTQQKMKLSSNKTTPYLKALVYHNLPTFVLHSFGVVHNL